MKIEKPAGCHFWDKQTNVGHDLADNKNIPNSPSKTKPRQPCKTDGDLGVFTITKLTSAISGLFVPVAALVGVDDSHHDKKNIAT